VETQALKRELDKFKPKVFLDIHSGMKALLAPYAFKDAPGLLFFFLKGNIEIMNISFFFSC
jgi:hypothetical protein